MKTTLEALVKAQTEAILKAAAQAVDEEARAMKAKHDEAVLSWQKKPLFDVKPRKESDRIVREIVVRDGEIWSYVNYGTGMYGPSGQPYIIEPVKAKALSFQSGYNAKTLPVARGNVGSGQRSGDTVLRKAVLHPGIEPRDFAAYFALESEETMPARIRDSIRRVLR